MEGSQGNRSANRQRGKSGLLASRVPWKIARSIKGGVSPWIVPQKITAPGLMVSGKGENVR